MDKIESIKDTTTEKEFCSENNLNKSQFYYHEKRLEKAIKSNKTIFQAISLNNKVDNIKEDISILKEVKISIGNANITIPAIEATSVYCLAHIRRYFYNIIRNLDEQALKTSRGAIGFNYCEQIYKLKKT